MAAIEAGCRRCRDVARFPRFPRARYYTCQHWLEEGRVDEVIELGEAAVAICRRVGDLYTRGMVLNMLAEARRRRGELAQPRR